MRSEELGAVAAQAEVVLARERLDEALAARRDAVLDLRVQGWSLQRIADLIGLSKAAVAEICRRP